MVRRLMLITCAVAVFACSTSVDDPAPTGALKAAVKAVQQPAENVVESASKPAKVAAIQPAQPMPQKMLKNDHNSVPKPVDTRKSSPAILLIAGCMNYCELVMDQRGQVKDQCPIECKDNPSRYTENDLVDEDTNMGLMVRGTCYEPCVGSSADSTAHRSCRQKCCVSSCVLRAEYNGGGYKSECPAMCREFLKKKAMQ